ncbi:MAG: nitronate monooxygenase, partial [Rhodoferax sp.]|nr:nitronate monooxygenase [Rhodoferax sp.]
MGGASTPKLAAAVSEAGGLGVLGAAACGPKMLREWIREIRSYTDKPFAVDTLLPASVRRDDGAKNSEGPSPMDLLPQHMAFAEEFMKREGLTKPTKEQLAEGMGAANR